MRATLYGMYQDLLSGRGFNYRIVSGTGDERLQNAIAFVDEYIRSARNQ
jgi:hypothetical protein